MRDLKIPRLPDISCGRCCQNCKYYTSHKQKTCKYHNIFISPVSICDSFEEKISRANKTMNTMNKNLNIYNIVSRVLREEHIVVTVKIEDVIERIKYSQNKYDVEKFLDAVQKTEGDIYVWWRKNDGIDITTTPITASDIDYLSNTFGLYSNCYFTELTNAVVTLLYEKYK